MPPHRPNPIAIAVLCVLGAVILTLAFLPLMTKSSGYTPPPKRQSWAPPFDPGTLPSIKPSNPQVCLPGTLGYNGLVTCTRQTDCASCTDDKTLECVTINNINNQLVDANNKTLNPPVPIHLYKKANGVCSGRGTQKSCDDPNAPANCTDYWCDCGSQYTSANGDPTNCDVQVLSVTEPGSFCLPSYVNACDPFTSNTILTNTGNGPQWICECKYPELFVQNNEGSNCDVPIACGTQQPQLVGSTIAKVLTYNPVNDGSCSPVPGSSNKQWQLCDLYPNQLVSSDASQTVPCTVPTESNTIQIDPTLSYQEITVSPLADPKCNLQAFTNMCTVQTGFDAYGNALTTQVMRGTGGPGDPLLTRLWPPFPEMLPFQMQACPDGWTGNGTDASPCVDPSGKGKPLAYLDQYGQWNGKYLSLQDLRNVGYTGPDATTCTGDTNCVAPQICAPAGVCVTPCGGTGDPACPADTSCVAGICSGVNDQSCNPSVTVPAVGVQGTLGTLPWKSVNQQCSTSPKCLEQSSLTLQQVKRVWTPPANEKVNLFPVTLDNISSSACSSDVQAPNCVCANAATPKTCSGPEECTSKVCNGGVCVTPCTQDSQCGQGEFCNGSICKSGCRVDGSTYTCNDPPTTQMCTAATGYQARAYNGALDGPVVADDGTPQGAACGCSGFVVNEKGQHVPLVAGALIDPSLGWTCVPDPCFSSGTNSYFNPETKQCVCGADSSGGTYYSWNTNNGAPTCQRDPCNPNGKTSTIQKSCSDDSDCSADVVTCSNNSCYVWTGKTCDPAAGNLACIEGITGGQFAECLQAEDGNHYCAVQDTTRNTCKQASDCALGICNTNAGLCTGGCICSNNTDAYYTDANPLHSACTDPCTFNPCGTNGICESKEDGSYICKCLPLDNPAFTGDSCENRVCLGVDSYCTKDEQCCSNKCTFYFFEGFLCE